MKRIKRFYDGIAFLDWHHFDRCSGTGIRWLIWKPGLFGILLRDGGLHVGFWWQVRFELVAVAKVLFKSQPANK